MSRYVLSRAKLAEGYLARHYASMPDAPPMPSQAERDAQFEAFLSTLPARQDLWVFAYGPPMWNPTIRTLEERITEVDGWRRSFCLRSSMARGTREQPGAMLALEHGGRCTGVAFRIAASEVREELYILWQREMLFDSYRVSWVNGRFACGNFTQLLTFVVNPQASGYDPKLTVQQVAARIRTARGSLGTNREYFEHTVSALARIGARDAYLEELQELLEEAA